MPGLYAVQRVSAALEAAHASQERINAFISIDDERALARAAEIDADLAAGEEVGPLAGIPVALKDLIEHEGRVTTAGSSFYAEMADDTAPCVARLEQAGAVIVGRTNLHEWAFGFNSENEHWGAVRNPWDPATSAGGSSGGSGAAVAAGISPIAIGTDTGGSVRVPAALCGTYGLKVTHGAVPLEGVFPLVPSIDTVGPLADSMEGIETAYRALSGDRGVIGDSNESRIGIPQPWHDSAPLEEAIASTFEGVVAALRDLGHQVHAIEMPDVGPSIHIVHAIAPEVRAVHRPFRERGQEYGEEVAARLDDAEQVSDEQIAAAREWQAMIRARFADAFGTVDFLLTPTVPVRRKTIGDDSIAGRHHRSVLSYYTSLVNHALHPALAMPVAGSGEPPASLQVIGSMGGEAGLIRLGKTLEREGVVTFRTAPDWKSDKNQA